MIVYVTECWLNLNEHEPCAAHIEHRFSFAPNERKLDATVHKNYKTKSKPKRKQPKRKVIYTQAISSVNPI